MLFKETIPQSRYVDENGAIVQDENNRPIESRIHHIFSNRAIRQLYNNMSTDYNDRIKILQPYLNLPHIKQFLDANWDQGLKINKMVNHGAVIHALIVQNPHNLIRGARNRSGDPGNGTDQELLNLMPLNYPRQINDMSGFLNLPTQDYNDYNIEWRRSGQRRRINEIWVDLWTPHRQPN